MHKKRILITEDDKHISKLVKYNLENAGYECMSAPSGEEAFKILERWSADLILLDVMLPGIDGFEVCRHIKDQDKFKHIPVVMLTAKGEEVDRVVGLELGADDYIVKPFSPRELILRVKAILRRGKTEENNKDILAMGILTVDIPQHKVLVSDKDVELTPMEFKLLATLMQRQGRVQTRDSLLSDVWGIEADVYTRTVDTHIKRIRQKIGKAAKFIDTVPGIGYRFVSEDDEN
ncbi:MAG: response regulator transcription factor [Candidatus Omnitrophica bacterium]|nr:response regulator transcription factor [Candidatus Omnitrophota bacterium]